MATISDRLKEIRKKRGYESAAAAARAMGVNETTYQGHENSSRGLTRDAAIGYAGFYKVRLDWLLNGKGSQETPDLAQKIFNEIKPALQPEALQYLEWMSKRP